MSSTVPRFAGTPRQLWLSTVVRVALAAVLLSAGGLKMLDPTQAVRAVQAYQLLPPGVDQLVGYGLPLLEIALGVLLLLGLAVRWAAIAAGVLMVVFISGIVSVWVRGLSIDCGCFGGGGLVSRNGLAGRYAAEILRDLLFLGLASWLAVFPASRFGVDRAPAADLSPVEEPVA